MPFTPYPAYWRYGRGYYPVTVLAPPVFGNVRVWGHWVARNMMVPLDEVVGEEI